MSRETPSSASDAPVEAMARAMSTCRTQERVIELLSRPDSYDHEVNVIETRETHGSLVFLAGSYVYKMKKSVKFGFLDYSTFSHRLARCRDEVRINRRLAPSIYAGVLVVVERAGKLEWVRDTGATPPGAVEALVLMRRIPDDALLGERIARGQFPRADLKLLVALLARFYAEAPTGREVDEYGAVTAIRKNCEDNFRETSGAIGDVISAARRAAIRSAQLATLALRPEVFERRVAEARIREGHGDLRVDHVAFVPDPVVIDAIEFSDRLRCGDVASDLAFLAVDFFLLGEPSLWRDFLDLYIEASGDEGITTVIDFYVSYRAHVRAKVHLLRAQQVSCGREIDAHRRAAIRYFELAHSTSLGLGRPRCVLVGGLSASGKSTLARRLGRELGADVLSSDELRREIVPAVADDARDAAYAAGRYSVENRRKVYAALTERAGTLLRAGAHVVVDATFSSAGDLTAMEHEARNAASAVTILECVVPDAVADERLRRRLAEGEDPSEATPDVLAKQRRTRSLPTDTAHRIDTGGTEAASLAAALKVLRERTRPEG